MYYISKYLLTVSEINILEVLGSVCHATSDNECLTPFFWLSLISNWKDFRKLVIYTQNSKVKERET